jgi:hypothetical protein
MERERKGQLSDVVKSRQERARFKSELTQLKDAVSSLLEQRNSTLKELEESEEEKRTPLENTKASVQFDDTGDTAFVDLKEVKDAIDSSVGSTKKELEELKAEREKERAQKNFQANVESVINQNKEVYSQAYKDLNNVYQALNEKVIELQTRTGVGHGPNGTLSQDEALELLSGSPEEAEFLKEHPGIDPTRIVRAFNSKIDLGASLKHLSTVLKIGVKEETAELDEKLKAAKDKPGGLAGHGNRNSEDTGDLISRVAALSNSDFENLSDAEVAKIEAMLLREELKGV